MTNQNPAWLDESHPNFDRWKRSRELSIERGKFVHSIINQKVNANNLSVLDLGSGEGGTSKVFSENNFVVSLDLNLIRLQRQLGFVISSESSNEKSSTKNKERSLSRSEIGIEMNLCTDIAREFEALQLKLYFALSFFIN
jgi:predicted rRNA methylase YqxC with S4 and FtsJ domains